MNRGEVISNAGSAFPLVNGFMKTAYARIEEADIKSLTANMLDSYAELCDKFGASVVSAELRSLYESQSADLEISLSRMRKLGGLLRHLQSSLPGDDGDGEARRRAVR